MKIRELLTYFTDTIFLRDLNEWRNPVVRWLVQQYRLLFYTARGLQEHGTIVRSAALTFYTLMSLVPIIAVVFAVVKGFGLADGLVENLYELFPQNPEIIDYIVGFAEKALLRTQGGVVAAVALVMLFWAVIRVFGSIENAFNNIWEVKVERSITRQWTDYIAVVMIVPLLWIVANALTNYAETLLGFDDAWYFRLLSRLASMAVIWAMFTLLYMVIPNARVRLGSALMAGIVAGTIFLAFQWGYVYVQRWMTSYNAIYGSFAALPLFLIWLQTSWEILLFGGELSFAYQNIERFGEERESLLINYDQRRKVMLAAMLAVVRHFRDRGGAMPAERIRRELNLPTRIVNDVLFQLVQAGQLIAVRSGEGEREVAYTPAYDIASMTVYGIIEAVERAGQTTFDLHATPRAGTHRPQRGSPQADGPRSPRECPADGAARRTGKPKTSMNRVVIIGSGNLAEALARALAAARGLQLVQIHARNEERGREVAHIAGCAWSGDPAALAPADLYLIAVSDRAVAEVAERLPIPHGAAVAHTAGSVPMEAIPAKFARRGVFYPMQTFTKGRAVDFRPIPIFLEASTPELLAELEEVAQRLSDRVIPADSERRSKIHLAAVFACNFANHMYALGEEIARSAGLDFDVLRALVAETAAKACDAASPRNVQTGPAVRGDRTTQERHEALIADPRMKEIYQTISQNIWETSRKI